MVPRVHRSQNLRILIHKVIRIKISCELELENFESLYTDFNYFRWSTLHMWSRVLRLAFEKLKEICKFHIWIIDFRLWSTINKHAIMDWICCWCFEYHELSVNEICWIWIHIVCYYENWMHIFLPSSMITGIHKQHSWTFLYEKW